MRYKAYKLLMILQGAFWFYLTIQAAFSASNHIAILIMMALDGLLYILLAFSALQKTLFKLMVPAFLIANTILTLTDQIGLMDYLVLGWNVILLILTLAIIFQRK